MRPLAAPFLSVRTPRLSSETGADGVREPTSQEGPPPAGRCPWLCVQVAPSRTGAGTEAPRS